MITRTILPTGAAVLALGKFSVSGTSHAAAQYQPQALNPVTERLWNGEAPAEIEALIEQLNPLVSEHPDLFGGVALSHDRQTVELFVANPDFETLAPDIGEIYTAHKDSVNTTNVEHSLSELIALKNTVHARVAHSRTSHSSIDVMNNVVKVGVGSPWVGQPACHSGQRTGQICRYFVESTNARISLEGVTVNNVATLYHDGNVDGVKDSNGFLKGNSGGPIYTHSNAQGGDLAYGIVTGYYTASDGHRRYAFTKFDGVLQWDPSIRFGE